eukprot:148520_1
MFENNYNKTICDINMSISVNNHICIEDSSKINNTNITISDYLCVTYLNKNITLNKQFDMDLSKRYYWVYKDNKNKQIYYMIYNEYYRYWLFNNVSINDDINSSVYILYCLQYNSMHPID